MTLIENKKSFISVQIRKINREIMLGLKLMFINHITCSATLCLIWVFQSVLNATVVEQGFNVDLFLDEIRWFEVESPPGGVSVYDVSGYRNHSVWEHNAGTRVSGRFCQGYWQ